MSRSVPRNVRSVGNPMSDVNDTQDSAELMGSISVMFSFPLQLSSKDKEFEITN